MALTRPSRDALTGLLDRQGLLTCARELEHTDLAFLLFGLDDLAAINDAHGHAAGDALLCAAAETLREGVRRHDLVARLEGDEFAAVLPGCEPEVAQRRADQLRGRVAYRSVDWGVSVTTSVGVASTLGGVELTELMLRADAALQEAKAAGGDTVRQAPQQDEIPLSVWAPALPHAR